MKRIVSLITLLLLIGTLTVEGFAAGSSGDVSMNDGNTDSLDSEYPSGSEGLSYTMRNGFYSVTGYTGNDTDLVIPERVNGVEVRYIESYAFYDRAYLTSVSFPSTLQEIGQFAFYGCSNLIEIIIPKSVIWIEPGAFMDCSALETLIVEEGNSVYHSAGNCIIETDKSRIALGCQNSIIPGDDSVRAIGEYAFAGCTELKEIALPNRVGVIEHGGFLNCTGLKKVNFTIGFSILDSYAFENCSSLTEIHLPTWMLAIKDGVFSGCTSLKSITVDQNCPYYYSEGNCIIDKETKTLVAGCNNSVIPDDGSITAIGVSAFKGMNGITELKIPDGVQTIGDHAFEGCIALTSAVLPDSVKQLGYFAFNECGALTEFTAPARNLAVGPGIFYNCNSLKTVYVSSITVENRFRASCPEILEGVDFVVVKIKESSDLKETIDSGIVPNTETVIENETASGSFPWLGALIGIAVCLFILLIVVIVVMKI